MPTYKKLADGMYDHGCCIQKPRYSRSCITCLVPILIVLQVAIFFTAMSSVIIQESQPIFSRIARKTSSSGSSSVGDAAIFYEGPLGKVHFRLCEGEVPVDCGSCSSPSSYRPGFDDEDVVKVDPQHGGAKDTHSKNNTNTGSGGLFSMDSSFSLSSSSSSSSTSSRRRRAQRWQDCDSDCTPSEVWSECPLVSQDDISQVIADANKDTNCQDFLGNLKKIHTVNTIWIVLAMFLIPVLTGPGLIAVARSMKPSYDTPLIALVIIGGVIGIAINGVFLVLNVLVWVFTKEMLLTSDGATVSSKNSCGGGGSLAEQKFLDENIIDLWRCAFAGLIFCAMSVGFSLLFILFVYIAPDPSYFVFGNRGQKNDGTRFSGGSSSNSDDWFNCPYFPDYEERPPSGAPQEDKDNFEAEQRKKLQDEIDIKSLTQRF